MTTFESGELVRLYYNRNTNINSIVHIYESDQLDNFVFFVLNGAYAIFLEYCDYESISARILIKGSIYSVDTQNILSTKS